MTDKPETERVDCTDCFALPGPANNRVSYVKAVGVIRETWHTPDCPQFTIMRINLQEGSKQVEEQETWARGVFPTAHERLSRPLP